jgi:hypothetical protein
MEAVRVLANWPDVAAIPSLRSIAAQAESTGSQIVAVQGLVRLASPAKDRPANISLLAEVLKLARRPEEKRMVLGVLGSQARPEALSLVAPAMEDPVLADEACLAAVLIVEKLNQADPGRRRAILEKARDRAREPQIRERALQALKNLDAPPN